jgi:hypothetical protein
VPFLFGGAASPTHAPPYGPPAAGAGRGDPEWDSRVPLGPPTHWIGGAFFCMQSIHLLGRFIKKWLRKTHRKFRLQE